MGWASRLGWPLWTLPVDSARAALLSMWPRGACVLLSGPRCSPLRCSSGVRVCPIYLFICLWIDLFLINSKGIFKKFLYRKLFHWFIFMKGIQTVTWEIKGKSQVF